MEDLSILDRRMAALRKDEAYQERLRLIRRQADNGTLPPATSRERLLAMKAWLSRIARPPR